MSKVKYYGTECQERLCPEIKDVVEEIKRYDNCQIPDFPITIFEFEPRKIDPEFYADGVLKDLLEKLDDEYADSDGDYTKPNEKMKETALTFVKLILDEYHVWSCERNGKKYEAYIDGTYKEIK